MKFATFAISPSKPFAPPPRLSFNLVQSKISCQTAARFRASATPARDRVIEFGKYKGKMLGTLPSAYLKWVSSNLRAGDTEEWARLADRVLADPVYRDRLEWEAAENILTGNAATPRGSAVAELLEVSQSFGWDNEDKSGWSKVDFALLGTSKSGRIPRAAARGGSVAGVGSLKEEQEGRKESGEGGKRGERRERVRRLREKATRAGKMGEERESSSPVAGGGAGGSPFPGRESLLKKVLNREKI